MWGAWACQASLPIVWFGARGTGQQQEDDDGQRCQELLSGVSQCLAPSEYHLPSTHNTLTTLMSGGINITDNQNYVNPYVQKLNNSFQSFKSKTYKTGYGMI